ncbi:MAG: A/G-specific adenine glycosylase [Alphaproteobacteria bacterium]
MPAKPIDNPSGANADLAARLLAWWDVHRRHLPWRAALGQAADPYAVWLSEIMLQQTGVVVVKDYFEKFVARWPTVAALAGASEGDVLRMWAGLGYYARARNLVRTARLVAARPGGAFPDTVAELKALPGIGDYTSAAIGAIAFGRQAAAMDGNAERVMARLYGVGEPLPRAKKHLGKLAQELVPARRPGDFAQSLMDLGATVCKPRRPDCAKCPWARDCRALATGQTGELPRKSPKKPRPTRYGVVFFVSNDDGAVLVRDRPSKGLLGGLAEFPSTPWQATRPSNANAQKAAPVATKWQRDVGEITHTFTHFHLVLTIWRGRLEIDARVLPNVGECRWVAFGQLDGEALPSLMRKVAREA